MTPAIVIVRYNSTDPAARRLHVREAMATCRWAVAQGYAPVCSLLHLADVNDPPEDTAGEVRERVMEYSATLARMVGAAGGVAIVPGWYTPTAGMEADHSEWCGAGGRLGRGVEVTLAEIEPYLPRDLVGQVQAAVDEAAGDPAARCGCLLEGCGDCDFDAGIDYTIDAITDHTGITPTEATAPRPMVIGQSCQILQDTDGIWRCVLSDGHWFGGDATRSKAADRARINGYEVTP